MLPLPSLPIAQVHTPLGPWYIAQAHDYHGFVVQRRYRGVGEPRYNSFSDALSSIWKSYEYYEAHWEPFLNPGAVRAAGLSARAIRRWAQAHPNRIFTHPTYATLCLRWGENALGYHVTVVPPQPFTSGSVAFTPHTCWETGTTYYELVGPVFTKLPDDLEQVSVEANLRLHTRELGQEGDWGGSYSTDRVSLEHALKLMGRHLVLAQPDSKYAVWEQISGDAAQKEVLLTSSNADETRTYYGALPHDRKESLDNPYICSGYLVQWPGGAVEWQVPQEKHVLINTENKYTVLYQAQGAMSDGHVRGFELADHQRPIEPTVVTLGEILNSTGMDLKGQARAMQWLEEDFPARLQQPATLTLSEIERLANLTKWSIAQLTTWFREEARAREFLNRSRVGSQVAAL